MSVDPTSGWIHDHGSLRSGGVRGLRFGLTILMLISGSVGVRSATQTYTISGRVTDGFGNGVSSATVGLNGTQSGSTKVDANGNYTFSNLQAGGNYQLTPSIPGRFDTLSFGASVNNLSGDVRQDLSIYLFSQFQVNIKDSFGTGIAAVGIRINNDPFVFAQTNSFGVANIGVQVPFVNSPPKNATFTPEKTGYGFSPASQTLVTSSSTQTVTFTGFIQSNPIDDAQTLVRQHYLDFLNREPDQSGWSFWTNDITSCGNNSSCVAVHRVNVSAAFFLSIEFQQTGYLVERIYKAAYGDASGASSFSGTLAVPVVRFNEFIADTQQIGQGVIVNQGNWQQQLEDNKDAFTAAFVQRQRFATAFPLSMTPTQFVDTLNSNAGNALLLVDRNQLISDLSNGAKTRAQVLRAVAENPNLANAEFNRAFVLMQYFGYLRRNPNDAPDSDYSGYDFWLQKLNQFDGNYINAEMVKAFINSTEYRARFGAP